MMRLVMAVAAVMTGLCAQSQAAVYTFTPTFNSDPGLYYTPDNLSFSIGINDTAVRSGSFSYDVRYKFNVASNSFVTSATGDVQALQFFRTPRSALLLPGTGVSGFYEDYFDVKLTFNASGQVTAGNVDYSTDTYYVFISGKSQTFNGTSGFGFAPTASISGALLGGLPASVPEPTTLLLLSASLIGSVFVKRRLNKRHAIIG